MASDIRALRAFQEADDTTDRVPVSRLGYVALRVPSPGDRRSFYEDAVGLHVTAADADTLHMTCDERHHAVTLLRGDGAADLDHVAFEISTDLESASKLLHDRGYGVVAGTHEEADRYALDDFIDVDGPEGVRVRLYNVMKRLGSAPQTPFVGFERLGHVGLGFDDVADAYQFFTDVFDLKTSDFIGERTAFMRCDPYHHSLVVTTRRQKRLHHVNFMVRDIDDIGRAIYRFERLGVPVVHGPGRHPTSTSIFLYFRTPDGLTHEYSFGMTRIVDPDHRPRVFTAEPDSVCLWGSRPTED